MFLLKEPSVMEVVLMVVIGFSVLLYTILKIISVKKKKNKETKENETEDDWCNKTRLRKSTC